MLGDLVAGLLGWLLDSTLGQWLAQRSRVKRLRGWARAFEEGRDVSFAGWADSASGSHTRTTGLVSRHRRSFTAAPIEGPNVCTVPESGAWGQGPGAMTPTRPRTRPADEDVAGTGEIGDRRGPWARRARGTESSAIRSAPEAGRSGRASGRGVRRDTADPVPSAGAGPASGCR